MFPHLVRHILLVHSANLPLDAVQSGRIEKLANKPPLRRLYAAYRLDLTRFGGQFLTSLSVP
jgi:hypothetical protein